MREEQRPIPQPRAGWRAAAWTTPLLVLTLSLTTMAAMAPTAAAQPAFQKFFTPSTIGPGSVSTLQFVITNQGSTGVRGLAFTDTLPAGVSIASPAKVSSSCLGTVSAPDGGSTITLADGAVRGSSSCTVSVDTTSATPGTHTNVSGPLTSDAGSGSSATADLTVATNRPGFSKSFSPSTIFFNGRSTMTFTIDNTANSSQAVNLSFGDVLPSGMTIADPANATTTCNGGLITAPVGGNLLTYGPTFFGDAQVAAGASCTVQVDVIGGATGDLDNVTGELISSSSGPSISSGKASATLTVNVEQISLSKEFLDDPVAPGGSVTLEFTIRNLNRSLAATSIAFSDDLSAVLSGLVATGLPLSDPCGAGSSLTGSSFLSLTGASLGAEGTCSFQVTLLVPATADAGVFLNTTSSISADLDGQATTGNPASDSLFVSAVPQLTKTFLTSPVGSGDSVTMELTITNTSTTSSVTDLAFTDNLDAFISGISVTSLPANGFCGAGSTIFVALIIGERTLFINGASLAPSASCTFSVDLELPVDSPAGTLTNTTSVLTATLDGETVIAAAASADLAVVSGPTLRKEFIDDPVTPGDTVTLQFTLSHSEEATADALGITFTDDLAATLAGLTVSALPSEPCGPGSAITGTTSLTLTGGNLVPGESCTFNVILQVPSSALPGSHTNTTSNVMSTVSGITVTSNAAQDELKVTGLTFTKSFTDDPVIAGGTVTLEFSLQNTSPTLDATDISFSDDLDDTVDNMTAIALPGADPCGAGSSLIAVGGNTLLIFQGGSLGPGESCTFSVTLQVPAATESDTYGNATSQLVATVDGATVFIDPATDDLVVSSELLMLTKEFIDDPVSAGDLVTLEFSLTNLASETATGIAFTDDLEATLSGLASVGTLNDVCGTGSQLSGTSFLSFTGGTLDGGASCTFSVSLLVPSDVTAGTLALNTTSQVTGTVGGLGVTGDPATDSLEIDFLIFTKEFDVASTDAGSTVSLTFNIQNPNETTPADRLSFSDDLDAFITGAAATGLPQLDVCGEGSELTGASFLSLSGASVLPGGSCTFSVDVEIPGSTATDTYVNETSELLENGVRRTNPATATLTVFAVEDADGDGVTDDVDVCSNTVIPEGVPTRELGVNRFALVDDDGVFDTVSPNGQGPGAAFTIEDTAGCSCEQIIAAQGLGQGHVKFGCSLSAMRDWVDLVNP